MLKIDKINNQVILGPEEELYKRVVYIENINLHVNNLPSNLQAKTRFRSDFYPCQVELLEDNSMKVIFDNPVKSPTPGQSLVLYSGDMLVGGGIIKSTE